MRRNKVSWISESKISKQQWDVDYSNDQEPHVYDDDVELNANIRTLLFRQRWPRGQALRTLLFEELTRPDVCITTIIFSGIIFELDITETFVNIFKQNPRIKHIKFEFDQFPDLCLAHFCNGLEYYHTESLEICHLFGAKKQLKMLAEGLKKNTTVTTFKLKNQSLYNPILFKYICKILKKSPSITSFKIWIGSEPQNFKYLARRIRQNRLKHLTIRSNNIIFDEYMTKALKTSTSLQSLEFRSKSTNYALLGEILQANKSIKKLKLDGSIMTKNSILELQLSTNTNLEELSIVDCSSEDGTNLFAEFESNTTLKSLRFMHNISDYGSDLNINALQKFLEKNKSLTELNLPALTYRPTNICIELAHGLKNNISLRKLSFYLANQEQNAVIEFFRLLKHNRGLTHLNIGPIFSHGNYINSIPLEDAIMELLTTNKTLRHIQGVEQFPHFAEQLKKNREEQDSIISNMCILIKMILMKPNSFILPIEVWSNIFKHASEYSLAPFDFEEFFNR